MFVKCSTGLLRWIGPILAMLMLGVFLALPAPGRAAEGDLYFVSTGHHLRATNGFLGYWRASDGPLTLGPPISEAFVDGGGMTVQYFTRGRLELHPEYNNAVLRGLLGVEYRQTLAQRVAPLTTEQSGARYFSETGQSLAEPFLHFWETHGGIEVFGLPVSEPAWEYLGGQLRQAQYFERARIELDPLAADPAQALRVADLGRELALLRGLPLDPVARDSALPVDDMGNPVENLPADPAPASSRPVEAAPTPTTAAPAPTQTPAAPPVSRAGRSIIVDLSDQWLYALENGVVVFDAPVATGRDGFNTPVGTFAVYARLRSQTMSGSAGGESWHVPNVPHVQYIVGGVAIHGAYWHNLFGSGVRPSHGCINMPLDAAAWLYNWSSLGTPVTVRW
jgi:lipoprotein-anchoring transpeptidase ErfK/SrfK